MIILIILAIAIGVGVLIHQIDTGGFWVVESEDFILPIVPDNWHVIEPPYVWEEVLLVSPHPTKLEPHAPFWSHQEEWLERNRPPRRSAVVTVYTDKGNHTIEVDMKKGRWIINDPDFHSPYDGMELSQFYPQWEANGWTYDIVQKISSGEGTDKFWDGFDYSGADNMDPHEEGLEPGFCLICHQWHNGDEPCNMEDLVDLNGDVDTCEDYAGDHDKPEPDFGEFHPDEPF
jgi:hypothetical protein